MKYLIDPFFKISRLFMAILILAAAVKLVILPFEIVDEHFKGNPSYERIVSNVSYSITKYMGRVVAYLLPEAYQYYEYQKILYQRYVNERKNCHSKLDKVRPNLN